jgi:hypothetical protein
MSPDGAVRFVRGCIGVLGSRSHVKTTAALAAIACALVAGGAAGAAGQGGTYLANGHDYDFALVNSLTAAWQSFYLVAPSGTSFVGGTTGNEESADCIVGPPDKIECGPLLPSTIPPSAGIPFVATTGSAATCGPAFALFVSTDGSTYVSAGDLVAAPSCGMQAPRALTPPSLYGASKVGATLRVVPPQWSSQPSRVAYHWERCTNKSCVTIAGAARPSLRLTPADAGHTIRAVVTATIAGVQVRVLSRGLFVRRAP